ncbi:unnamed protein product [Stenotrophomonas maltophilia]|nr:unnamed protein product [Stenotrophomonas maltophilia]
MQVSSFPATCRVRGRGFRELHEDDGPHQGSGGGGGGNGGDGRDRRSRTARNGGGDQAGVGGIKNHGAQKTPCACRCQVLRCKKPMQRSSANVPTFGCN